MRSVVCSRICTGRHLAASSRTFATQLIRNSADKSADTELPPEPTTCCMSGCANCVWLAYAELLSKNLHGNDDKARQIILDKISDPNLKVFLAMELRNIAYNKELARK